MNKFMPTKELEAIAIKKMPDGGVGNSLPVMTKAGSIFKIVVFWFRISPQFKPDNIYPPHRIIFLNPVDGKLLEDAPCTPKGLGMNKSSDSPDKYIPISLTWDEYSEKKDKFYRLSPMVWMAFESERTKYDQQTVAFIKEYYTAFLSIESKALLPYYHSVAPDFFKWLNQMSK